MKIILIIFCTICSLSGLAQGKSIQFRDSIAFTDKIDTLYGTVSYPIGYNGTVKGDGMLIHHTATTWHFSVPAKPWLIKNKETSFKIGNVTYYTGTSGWGEPNEITKAYLKTKSGWKEIDWNIKYTFLPQ